MVDEVYDVVDKDGNLIGKATWTKVHSEGLLHQSVHGLLFKDQTRKQVLFKKRTKDAAQEPDVWETSVAGHIITNETPEISLKREIEEEILDSKEIPQSLSYDFVCKYFNNDIPNNHEIAYLYEVFYDGPTFLEKNEAVEFKWFVFDKLLREINNSPSKFAKYSINDVEEYLKFRKK